VQYIVPMQDINFDKFMDDLLEKQASAAAKKQQLEQETPQREYVRRYRELPINRTRVG